MEQATPTATQNAAGMLLQSLLGSAGQPWLPSVWLTQLQLHAGKPLEQLQGYLNHIGQTHRLLFKIDHSELAQLGPLGLAHTDNGELALVQDLRDGAQPGQYPLRWVLDLQPSQNPLPTQSQQKGLGDFYRMLRSSQWLQTAVVAARPCAKPLVYGSLLINLLGLAAPFFAIQMYDRIVPNHAYGSMFVLVVGVLLALGFEHVLKHARHNLLEQSATVIDARCTESLAKALLAVRTNQTEPALLLQHLRSFEQLRELITGFFLLAVIDLPFLLLFLLAIGLIHPFFFLIASAMVTISLVWLVMNHRKLAALGQVQMRSNREAQTRWLNTLAGLEAVQAFGVQATYTQKLARAQMQARMHGNGLRAHLFELGQHIHVLQQASWLGVLCVGAALIMDQQLSVGGLIATSMLTMRCFAPIQKLQGHLAQTHAAQASFEELNQFMQTSDQPSASTHKALGQFEGLELAGVSVIKPKRLHPSPLDRDYLLRNIHLDVPAGERLAVIGQTGSGKTSLLKLIAGQLDNCEGTVLFNHLERTHFDTHSLAHQTGFACQPPVLVQGSLLDNIVLGRPWIGAEQALRTLHQLGLSAWVQNHPDGLMMPIESYGANLSTGQRQAVCLARAFCGEPQLILLDEPTIGLDHDIEARLHQMMANLPPSCTVIFSTHKLNLLGLAKRLALMHEGRLHAHGDRPSVMIAANQLAQGPQKAGPAKAEQMNA